MHQNHGYYPSPPHLQHHYPRGIPPCFINDPEFVNEILFPREIFQKIDKKLIDLKLQKFGNKNLGKNVEGLSNESPILSQSGPRRSNSPNHLSSDKSFEGRNCYKRGGRSNKSKLRDNYHFPNEEQGDLQRLEEVSKSTQKQKSGQNWGRKEAQYGVFRLNCIKNGKSSHIEIGGLSLSNIRFMKIKLHNKEIKGFY